MKIMCKLRTVPPFATAYTFCASLKRKTGFFMGLPAKTEIFYDYAGKADLGKGYWNPKRKLGVTTHYFFRDN